MYLRLLPLLFIVGCIGSPENKGQTNNGTNNATNIGTNATNNPTNNATNNATNNTNNATTNTNNETTNGIAARDWTPTIATVFIEGGIVDLTSGSITSVGSITADASCPVSARCPKIEPNAFLNARPTNLSPLTTFGGWIFVSDDRPNLTILDRSTAVGASLKFENDRFVCSWDGASTQIVQSAPGLSGWQHVVCTIGLGFRRILVNGIQVEVDDDDISDNILSAANVTIGASTNIERVLIDEIFITSDLTTAEIARIYACGVDGSACRCGVDNEAAYVNSGRAGDVLLPACDSVPLGF